MPLTTRAVSYLAGRIGGRKAAERTMNWMNKTALGNVLGYGGDLGLMFGVGKGLQAVGKISKLANTGVGRAATTAGNFIAGTPASGVERIVNVPGLGQRSMGITGGSPNIFQRGLSAGQRLGGQAVRGAQAVGRAALANPEVTGAVLTSLPAMSQQSAAAEQQRQMNAMLMQQTAEQQRRRQELMDILRPLFIRLQQGG